VEVLPVQQKSESRVSRISCEGRLLEDVERLNKVFLMTSSAGVGGIGGILILRNCLPYERKAVWESGALGREQSHSSATFSFGVRGRLWSLVRVNCTRYKAGCRARMCH
jgi:hypothetical protein